MKRAPMIFIAMLGAAVLVALGYAAGHRHAPSRIDRAGSASTAATADGGKRVLYWYDTMVPQQHFDHPRLSPMGMQMVPRYADRDSANDKGGVQISPSTVQKLGVRTAIVARRVLVSAVEVPGTISWNLRQATIVSARVDAVVSKLDVRAPYTTVTAGQPLAELLAPQWSSALAEYSALQIAQSADAKALRSAARERLRVLGLTPADIRAARHGAGAAITLHAPQAGVVTTLEVRDGQRVGAGQTLMTLNGLSSVWVEAALPQAVAGAMLAGTPVTVRVDGLPGQIFQGTVETLLPDIDNTTRTQRARIVIDNPHGVLSPGMFATVQLNPSQGKALPVVPADALIATGSQTRVIVAEGDGRFRAAPVQAGRSAGGYTEILAGLEGGEQVVISGQFLIDSEASLSGALERLNSAPATAVSAPAPAASAPMAGMPMGHQR